MAVTYIDKVIKLGSAMTPYIHSVFAPLGAYATNISADLGEEGTTLKVKLIGANTAPEFSHDTGYANTGSLSTKPVELASRIYAANEFTDTEWEQLTDTDFINLARTHLHVLFKKVSDTIVNKIKTDVTNELVAGAASDLSYAKYCAMVADASALTMPIDEMDRNVVLASGAYAKVASDPVIAASTTSLAESAMKTGVINEIAGTKLFKTGAVDTAFYGFMATRTSIALVARATPIDDVENAQIVTGEELGLPVVIKVIPDPKHSKKIIVSEFLFGAAVVDPSNIAKIVATA